MTLYAPQRHDIVVQNADGQFIAIIEDKKMQDLTRDAATSVRRNSMKYSLLPQTPYFLLLAQDRGFLWKEAWIKGPETPPTYAFFFQAEDGIRDLTVTGVQTCALPI